MLVSTHSVRIGAGADLVWRALTDPDLVRRWQFGSELVTDWVPGSPIRFIAEWQGQRFEQWGTVLSFDPPHELRYRLFAPRPDLDDRPEHCFTMIYELASTEPGATLVTFTHEDPRPVVAAEPLGSATDLDSADSSEPAVSSEPADSEADAEPPILRSLREVAESLVIS